MVAITAIPEVDAFEIPTLGITLTDQDSVAIPAQLAARKILVDVLQGQVLDRQRHGTFLCGTQQADHVEGLYRAHNGGLDAAGLPRISVSEFRAKHLGDDIVRDDADCDPRLPLKTFLVAITGDRSVLGLFTLYNVVIEIDDASGITATAMAMPGCNPAPGHTMRATWAGIMRHILENDLVFGGRRVDFIEWRFPRRAEHRWHITERQAADAGGDSETCAAVGTRLEVADLDDHDVAQDVEGFTLRVRRKRGPVPRPLGS